MTPKEKFILETEEYRDPKQKKYTARIHFQHKLIGEEIEKLRKEKSLYIANRYGLSIDTTTQEH